MRVNTGKPLSSNGNAGRVSSAESKEKLKVAYAKKLRTLYEEG